MYSSVNPYTDQHLEEFDCHSNEELHDILESLKRSYTDWKIISLDERLALVKEIGNKLENVKQECAELISTEMGKPLTQSLGEINKSIGLCRYYYDNSKRLIDSILNPSIQLDSIGIILAVMPWNFPVWQLFRVLIPQIIMGNVILCKPAPNVSMVNEFLAKLFYDVSILKFVRLTNAQVADCIKDSAIRGVTLTGSVRAGKAVATIAAAEVKPTVLELGGSDPFIVTQNADLDLAAENLLLSRFQNAGQSCIAAKRLIIHHSVKIDFLERLIAGVKTFKYGDPLDLATNIGPLARKSCQDTVMDQVKRGLEDNASLLYQSDITHIFKGCFFPATIIEVFSVENNLWKEEVFGPVLAFMSYDTDEEAVRFANASEYGLGASVWSKDEERQNFFIKHIEAGMLAINKMMVSTYDRPFGGIKQSGYGQELALEGLLSFINKKQLFK